MRPPARDRPGRRAGAPRGGWSAPAAAGISVVLAATIGGCGEVARVIEPVTCWAEKHKLEPAVVEGILDGHINDQQGVWLRTPDGRRIDFGWPEEFRVEVGPGATGAVLDAYGIEIVRTGDRVRLAGGFTPDGQFFTPCEINGTRYAWPPPPGE